MSSNFEMFSVTEKRTGRRVCVCGNEQDALMMVSLDPDYRSYSLNRFILDQIIDVTSITDKQLPENQSLSKQEFLESPKLKLPEGEGNPVNI